MTWEGVFWAVVIVLALGLALWSYFEQYGRSQ